RHVRGHEDRRRARSREHALSHRGHGVCPRSVGRCRRDPRRALGTDRLSRPAARGSARAGGGPRPTLFPYLRRVVVLSDRAHADTVGWREMLDAGRDVSDDPLRTRAGEVDPEQTAFMLYTSGTTGFPKGALHDHRMVRNTWDHGDRMGITVNDVI